MTEDDLDTDIAHGGARPGRIGGVGRAHRQNQWTLPASEASPNKRSERARRTKKDKEESASLTGSSERMTKARQSRAESSAWEVQEEEERGKEQRRRRRKRKEGGKEEKQPFSSVARCRNADIKIALVEEGIVWSGLDMTAGSGKRSEAVTLPYERIVSASWPQGSSSSKTFVLNYAEESGALLRPRTMEVLVGEEAEAKRWIKYTNKIIASLFHRPKKVRVFLHVDSGRTSAASVFKTHGFPKLRDYNIDAEITEVSSAEDFGRDVRSLDQLSDYDGFLVAGNQLSLRFLLNAVMARAHLEQNMVLRPGSSPLPCPLPLGLLPTGRRADVANSVHGTSDFVTSLMHFVLGSKISIDVCAVFGKTKFLGWAVNCQYGYAANALHEAAAKRIASDKRFQSALAKMLSKERLLTYECDVHYMPCKESESFPTDRVLCTRGCEVCEESNQHRQQSSDSCDQVVELNALGDSQGSNSMIELQEESRWRTLKGSFLWVGLYVLPCRNEVQGPRGMSPYAHLADGCADLVLVRDCKRKEFLRFLKRHGAASKSHLDFTFVETHRVTGVRFQARQNITWEHRDITKSEIDYHMETHRDSSATTSASSNGWENDETPQQKRRTKLRSKPKEMVIDDCGDDDDDDDDEPPKRASKPGLRSSASLGVLRCTDSDSSSTSSLSDDDASESGTASASPYRLKSKPAGEEEEEDDNDKAKKKKKKGLRRLSLFSLKTTEANSQPNRTYIRPRLMLSEVEHAKRKARAMKKEDKLRKMAEERLRSVWMADYEVLPETELEFQVYSNLVEIFAVGPPEGEKADEVRLPWLPIF